MNRSLTSMLTLTFEEQRILREIVNRRVSVRAKRALNEDPSSYIICNETGEKFKNKMEIAKKYNITPGAVSNYFNGIQKTLKKLTFKEIKAD